MFAQPTTATTRTVTLAEGDRQLVFRYAPGCESQVMDHICRLAEQGRCGVDWLTAATLCFQVAAAGPMDRRAKTTRMRHARR